MFQFMVFTFLENAFSPLKTPGRTFWKSVSPKTKGENYDLLYQNSIRKYEDNLEH